MAAATAIITEDDEATLWLRFATDRDSDVRAQLFDLYLDFARRIARRAYRRRSPTDIDQGDLFQEACSALLESIDRFDVERGVPFRGFAARRIIGSMSDVIRRSSERRQQLSERDRIVRERARDLAAGTADSRGAEDALTALSELAISLALGFMIEETSTTIVTTGRTDGYSSAVWHEMLRRLNEELTRLPDRERRILDQHYVRGIGFRTIALALGLSNGRVSQLHRSALGTLRKRLAYRGHVTLRP